MPHKIKQGKETQSLGPPPYNTHQEWPNIEVPSGLDPERYAPNRQIVSENVPAHRIGVPGYSQFGDPDFSVNNGQLQFKLSKTKKSRLFFRIPKNAKKKVYPMEGDTIKLRSDLVVRVDYSNADGQYSTGYIDVSLANVNKLSDAISKSIDITNE